MVPYLIGTIGETGYGVYALVWSLTMSVEQLQMSLQQGVVKYSAGFIAQKRIDEVNKVVSSSFIYSVILAILSCAGTLIAANFYKGSAGQIGSALVITGIIFLFIIPLTPYIAVIQSRQRYYVGAIASAISKYVGLLAVVAWFQIGKPSVSALIVIMTGTLFLSKLSQVPIAYHLVPGLKNNPRLSNRETLALIVYFGGMVVLISLCQMLNTTGIRWLMNSLVSTSFVAHLAIMLMPTSLMSQAINAMTITGMPATSAYEATGNQKMLHELLIRGIRYTTILELVGLVMASLLMKNVLSLWVGKDYMFLSPYALVLFASGAFMQSTSISHFMLKGMGKLRIVVLIYSVGLVILPAVLILSTLRIMSNPYVAITIGLSVGHLACGYLNILFCTKTINASMREVIMRAYIQPIALAAVFFMIIYGIVTLNCIDGFIARSVVSVFLVFLFLSSCYTFIATDVEKREMKTFLNMVFKKIFRIL
ncbi:MAG TPA: hypothetical protein VIS94_12825 [Desulfomonilia bacterium]